MAKLVAKLVKVTVMTRVLVSEDATYEETLAIAKPRLLSNLEKDYEDCVDSVKRDKECPYEQGEEIINKDFIDVYASVDAETYKSLYREIMSYSIDGTNYSDNDHRLTNDDDYNVNIRILRKNFKYFEGYTNCCHIKEIENED